MVSNYEGQQETISVAQFTQEMRKRHVFTQEEQYAMSEELDDHEVARRLYEENAQLRALLSDCLNRLFVESFVLEYDTPQERQRDEDELHKWQEQAKTLGVEVTE